MRMNDFEKYIKENKRKFNLDEINPKIWENIELEIKGKKTREIFLRKALIGVAAAILIGLFSFQWYKNQQKVSFPEPLLVAYGFKDANLDGLLESKYTAIKQAKIPVAYKNDLEMLLKQVTYLDQHFAKKIEQLNADPTADELKIEILEYYKTKSEILDRVILEIQKINRNETAYGIKSEKTNILL